MSHFSTIKTQIKDLEVLKEGLSELGYHYEEGDLLVRGWAGQSQRVELLVEMGKGYNIGFRRNKLGNYEAVADWMGVTTRKRAFTSELAQIEKVIAQKYAYKKVLKEVKKQGYNLVEEKVLPDNTIKLVVRKWE